jgi:hypothetical protein
MGTLTDNVGTFNLAGASLTILETMGVRNISVLLVSGSATVKGTLSLGSLQSTPLALEVGTPLNVSFDFAIDGYIIDAAAGVVKIITGR